MTASDSGHTSNHLSTAEALATSSNAATRMLYLCGCKHRCAELGALVLVSYMPLAVDLQRFGQRAPTWGREFITRRELDSGRRALVDLGFHEGADSAQI